MPCARIESRAGVDVDAVEGPCGGSDRVASRSINIKLSDCGGGSDASFVELTEGDGLCPEPFTCNTCANGLSDALELTLDAGDKGRSRISKTDSEFPLDFFGVFTSGHVSFLEAEGGGSVSSFVDAGVVGASC